MKLYDYQSAIVEKVHQLILLAGLKKQSCRALIVAGTGAGKTVIAANLIHSLRHQGKRVLFLVDMEVLVAQAASKFQSLGIQTGYIKAGYPEDLQCQIQIASIQTLAVRSSWRSFHWDVLIWDEAHTTAFSEIGKELICQKYPQSHHIGLTATPWRTLPTEGLDEVFQHQVNAPLPIELIQRGYLVPFRYFTLPKPGLESVAINLDGDYNLSGLSVACNKPHLVNHLVDQWHQLAFGRRTVAFSVDTDHAHAIAEAFAARNIPSAVVTGKTSPKERRRLYQQVQNKEILALASCGVLSKGFDLPEISCVLGARPTTSRSLYFQQIGRASRTASGKIDALLLDQAGNFDKFGALEDLTEDQLWMVKGRTGRSWNEGARWKQCPLCYEQHPIGRLICPCGYSFVRERQDANHALIEVFPQLQRQIAELKASTRKLQEIGGLNT